MKLSEIFCSIQGESTYSGLPCIFIRLAECNLRCNYCDSTYSYNTKFTATPEEIINQIREYNPIKLVEITGGEPLLQAEVIELIHRLRNEGYEILLETNGSCLLKNIPKFVHKIVDIKLPDSGEGNSFLIDNLQFINPKSDEIKFVLSSRKDYIYMRDKLNEYHIQNHQILLSCVFDRLEPKQLSKWVIEDRLQVRIQLQLHKYIWDPNVQGV
jgi:7-carboxy-7-deazaguanine synthase